jgi:NADPH:quinone reductase
MKAIQVSRHGGPEVLELVELSDPAPGPTEVVVRSVAIGVNFVETYQRSGLYPVELPLVPGGESAGEVVAVGDAVDSIRVGDRIVTTDAGGSYAELAVVPAGRAVIVPDGLGLDLAAAVFLQGLTAHYLANDTFPLGEGHRCLIHAGAGGVGSLLIQMAKRRGAEVFATAGGGDKVAIARAAGADHVIDYLGADFKTEIESIAGPRPLDVVYDGVGKDTFLRGLGLLRRLGMMVSYGNASGPPDPISPLALRDGSLFLTRPMLPDYTATTEELQKRAAEVLSWVEQGKLEVRIGARFPLTAAADAHRALEGRQTTGKVLLEP